EGRVRDVFAEAVRSSTPGIVEKLAVEAAQRERVGPGAEEAILVVFGDLAIDEHMLQVAEHVVFVLGVLLAAFWIDELPKAQPAQCIVIEALAPPCRDVCPALHQPIVEVGVDERGAPPRMDLFQATGYVVVKSLGREAIAKRAERDRVVE